MSMRGLWVGAAALILLSGQAFAQGAVQSFGTVVQGHLPMWAAPGLLMDAGGSTGLGVAPQNQDNAGTLPTGLGIVNSGLGYCAFSAYASAAYNSLCFGFDVSGDGLISLSQSGGGTAPNLKFSINGVVIPFGSGIAMNADASNAVLPDARTNLGLGTANTPAFAGVTVTGDLVAAGEVDGKTAYFNPADGSAAALFTSVGAHDSVVRIDNDAGGNQSILQFDNAGVPKWQIVKGADNSYNLFNVATGKVSLNVSIGGVTTLGEAGSTGNALVGDWSAPSFMASLFYAKKYGSCTWDSTHDVGACINTAIAAAAANGGGKVLVPAGLYGWSTNIAQHTAGVKLMSEAGFGIARDTVDPTKFLAATRLLWIGAAEAGPALDISTAGTTTIYAADVGGIVFDCASLVDTCVRVRQVASSKLEIGQAEARKTGILFDTTSADALGNHDNDVWLTARNVSASFNPTGIVLDSGAAATFNTSGSRFHSVSAAYAGGDGIVLGNFDTNHIDMIGAYHYGAATTGSPVVCANSVYVPPSGVAVNGRCYDNKFEFGGAIYFGGLTNGATVTVGTHAGTGTIPSVTISTNGTTAAGNATLHFASTTGIAANESINCGGVSSGVFPYTTVLSLTATTIVMAEPAVIIGGGTGVASGQSCTFGLSATSQAVAGSYTLTANSSTNFTLTAPAGGHTQTAIVSSGVLNMTDMIIPIGGTANNGDTWTIVLPTPSTLNRVAFIDKANSVSDDHFEVGATGSTVSGTKLIPVQVSGGGYAATGDPTSILPVASGRYSLAMAGSQCTASGLGAACLAGVGSSASGSYDWVAGHNNTSSGYGAGVFGEGNTASGTASLAYGLQATDRGRYGNRAAAAGFFAVQGDAQIGEFVLRGTGTTSGGAVALTGDQAAAGSANCVNIPNNTVFHVAIHLAAIDHTAPANNLVWDLPIGVLSRGANAASTAWTAGTPVSILNGTTTGWGVTPAADTTNGCLALTFTHPTTTNTWNAVARIATTEVQ